ncbi:MAG: hypothetical protein ABW186_06295 [Rhodanobacteraceae bacterium]
MAGIARWAVGLVDAVRRRALVAVFVVFAGADFAAPPRPAVFFVADFFAGADFFVAFFAAVFVRVTFRAVLVLRAALLGALRAAAFFARFCGAPARADFVPVDRRADFFAALRGVLLLRLVGLIAVSGSASRAEVRRLRENFSSKPWLYSG